MKRMHGLLLLLVVLLAAGCEELLQIDPDPDFFVDEATALTVAENLLFPAPAEADIRRRELRAADYTVSKTVRSVHALADDDGNALMYVVNYEEEAFVILSADRRLEPILAHSLNNGFSMREELYSPGLIEWLNEFASYVMSVRQARTPASRHVELMWEGHISERTDLMSLTILTSMCGDGAYTVTTGPLLETEWGQGCGYNDQVPHTGCGSDWCGRAPTGCLATAMAQILKHAADHNGWHGDWVNENDVPIIMTDWAGMPDSDPTASRGSHLPFAMQSIGGITDMSYDCGGSAASTQSAHRAFQENFGFSAALLMDLSSTSDYQIVIDEIDAGRPVFMRGANPKDDDEFFSWWFPTYGGGHAWVADGHSHRVSCATGAADTYRINMNWGWSGKANGEFIKKDGRYPHHRKIIYNLVPPPAP